MITSLPSNAPREEKTGVAALTAGARRHLLLFIDYFTQYSKVRMSYRADFFISLATSMAATIFSLGFVIVLFQKATELGNSWVLKNLDLWNILSVAVVKEIRHSDDRK